MPKTDFGKIKEYSNFVSHDPFRNELHYPAILKALGAIQGKRILDVGCGDGLFTRMLADKGGQVVGYDMAPELIDEAKNHTHEENISLRFIVATPETFKSNEEFDFAISVMVLSYATSLDNLKSFFISTHNALRAGGSFSSVIFNPEFERFNKIIGTRRFVTMEDNTVQVNFLNPNNHEVTFTSLLRQFTKEDYESSARTAGFTEYSWIPLYPSEESEKEFGKDFWADVILSQPYSVFVARK